MTEFCPACDKPFLTMKLLKDHIDRARTGPEPDDNHIDIADLEGWDEVPLEPN